MPSLPDLGRLAVTSHAYERARERLNISIPAFRDWVEATKSSWLCINPDFYRAHGVIVSADKYLYHCPWTPGLHLCLPVSTDVALVTVMAYEPRDDRAQAAAAGEQAERMERLAKQLRGELDAANRRWRDAVASKAEVLPGAFMPKDAIARAAIRALCHGCGSPTAALAAAGVDYRTPRASGWFTLVCRAYADDAIGLDDLRRLAALPEARPLLLAAAKDDYAAARGRGVSTTTMADPTATA